MKQAVRKTLGIAALGAAFTAAGAGVAAADSGVPQEARHAGLASPDAAAPNPMESAGTALGAGQYAAGKATGLDAMGSMGPMGSTGSGESMQPKAATDTLPSNSQGSTLGGLPLNGLPIG